MAKEAFRTSGQGNLSQPSSSGETIYARSSNASDTQTITFYGDVSSSPANEGEFLDGKKEQVTSSSFESPFPRRVE